MKKIFLSAILIFSISICIAQTTRYVTQNGSSTKDGSSWANASDDIQAMINASSEGDRIFVAIGSYKPNRRADALNTITVGDRANAFVLKNGVKLYGGFDPDNGIDDLSKARIIPSKNGAMLSGGTILNGDFNGDDIITGSESTLAITNNSENAHHVVIAVGDLVNVQLDGFTVKGGNANNDSDYITVNGKAFWGGYGGGIYSWASTSTLTLEIINCEIKENYANSGAGIFSWASYFPNATTVNINQTCFINNKAARGGAICANATNVFLNLTFSDIAGGTAEYGAGIYIISILSSTTTISNTSIRKNYASNFGGGMYAFVSGSVITPLSNKITLAKSDVSENSAVSGAGIYAHCSNYAVANSEIMINSSQISRNVAMSAGGGIYAYASSSSVNAATSSINIVRSKIEKNSGLQFGGGMFSTATTSQPNMVSTNSVITITGSSISGNLSAGGAAVYSVANTTNNVLIRGSTVAANVASSYINLSGIGNKTFASENSIVLGNRTSSNTQSVLFLSNGANSIKNIRYSLFQGENVGDGNLDGTTAVYTGENQFNDFSAGDYTLKSGSAAINAGSNSLYEAADGDLLNNSLSSDLDLNDNPRVYNYANNGIVDMGAYEFQQLTTLPVTLVDFKATKQANWVALRWRTSQERNNKEFILSSSTDGSSFKEISRLPSAVSQQLVKDYLIYDKHPNFGTIYYKLEQVDMDGKVSEIGKSAIDFKLGEKSTIIFNNPIIDFSKVSFQPNVYNEARLVDMFGKQLIKQFINKEQGEIILNLSGLPKGFYLVYFSGKESAYVKLLKQ